MKRIHWPYWAILFGAALLFLPGLGHVHLFDWDEINFAECAREMIATKNYLRVQIDFQPFWEKPPLFIWLQVLCMKLLGVNEYAARLPNALVGMATLVSVYHIGRKLVSEKLGWCWTAMFAASWLPHFYFKSGIIDPLFNLLIFAAFYQAHRLRFARRKWLPATLSGIFLGLAVLTKGPVALLIAGLCFLVYLVFNKGLRGYKISWLLLLAVVTLLTTASWFLVEISLHGFALVEQFIGYQVRLFRTEDAGHGGPFIYHFIVLLLGCFPASVFLFLRRPKALPEGERSADFTRWMWILFWVVLLLFSIVKTKIVHYSSLCYFPLTFLAAMQAYRLLEQGGKLRPWLRTLLTTLGSLLALAIGLLPLAGLYRQRLIPYIHDRFAVANLQAAVPWSGAECAFGAVYLSGLIVCGFLLAKKSKQGLVLLCVLQLLIIQATVYHFVPKIEAYSQRSAIEFFESRQEEHVYVYPLGYKSYAHLFYSRKQPPAPNEIPLTETQLLYAPLNRPAYFVCKITEAAAYRALPQLQKLYEKNGFIFFKRR